MKKSSRRKSWRGHVSSGKTRGYVNSGKFWGGFVVLESLGEGTGVPESPGEGR